MAISFRGISSGDAPWNGSNHNNGQMTLPKPAGVVAGDFLLAVVLRHPLAVLTPPAGWSLLAHFSATNTSVYYRFAEAGEPSSYTWVEDLPSQPMTGVIHASSGADPDSPIGAYAETAGTVSSGNCVVSGISTGRDNSLLVTWIYRTTETGWTPPGGHTERLDVILNGYYATAAGDENIATAGATGTRTWVAPIAASGIFRALAVALQPIPGPTIESVTPAVSTTDGGTAVSITGTNFDSSTSVTIGGVAATGVQYLSPTALICVTPAHAAGAVDVVVTGAGGSDTLTNGITYVSVSDSVVSLVKGGAVTGDNKAVAGDWPVGIAARGYGGPTDLWGTTLTPADVNAADFGVVLSAVAGTGAIAQVDSIRIKVFFSLPGINEPVPYVAVLRVAADRQTTRPEFYQLPRAGLTVANDPAIDRAISDATLATSRLFAPSRNIEKVWRTVELYAELDPQTNTPGLEVWASVDGGAAFQMLNASGTPATILATGQYVLFFPRLAARGRYVQLELRVPALSGEEVPVAAAVRDLILRGAFRPLRQDVIETVLILTRGEYEDQMSGRRSPAQQLVELEALAAPGNPAIEYRDPQGNTGFLHVISVRHRELTFQGRQDSDLVAILRLRTAAYA